VSLSVIEINWDQKMEILAIDNCPFCQGTRCQKCQNTGKIFKTISLVDLFNMVEIHRITGLTFQTDYIEDSLQIRLKK
jgi:hypothetical protein